MNKMDYSEQILTLEVIDALVNDVFFFTGIFNDERHALLKEYSKLRANISCTIHLEVGTY